MSAITESSTVVFTGACILQHRASKSRDPQFLELVDFLRGADLSTTNLEAVIDDGTDWPAFVGGQGGFGSQYCSVPTWAVEELKWHGFDLVFTANNHFCDLGEGGILTTLKYLDEGGLLHSGSGRNMTQASAPTYACTGWGRVATINASDNGIRGRGEIPFPVPRGCLAADQGPWFPDRPGINMIRYEPVYHVDKPALDALRRASQALGWEHDKALRRMGAGLLNPSVGVSALDHREDTDELFHFNGTKYQLADEFGFETVPYAEDLERNYTWIREARRTADIVIVGMHQQGSAMNEGEPPDHTRIFAHGAIDAGADVFVGHGGQNRMFGIERYNGGVIIWGVPGYITTQRRITVPLEQLRRFGLTADNTPSDLMDIIFAAKGKSPEPGRFGTYNPSKGHAVFSLEFGGDAKIRRVLIHPSESTGPRGIPKLATPGGEISDSVLQVVTERSEKVGTTVKVLDGVGVIELN
jgi:poly-gamma-glutamate capsule biosynthesis protein CapA/YwtB (metallophosphatase superfamily)